MVLGPARIIRDHRSEMTYIGHCAKSCRTVTAPDEARWASGLAAWDLLYSDRGGELMGEVNSWLSDENRLSTGYRLEHVECAGAAGADAAKDRGSMLYIS